MQAGEHAVLDARKFGVRQAGLAQQLRQQRHKCGQVLVGQLKCGREPPNTGVEAQCCLQGQQGLGDLLGRFGACSQGEHGPEHGGQNGRSVQAVGRAPAQAQRPRHAVFLGLARQHRHLQARLAADGKALLDHPGLDVLRRGRKVLRHRLCRLAAVVCHQGRNIHTCGNGRTRRRLQRWQVAAHGAVGGDEIGAGHAAHVLQGHGLHPVALGEQQTPVAQRNRFAQRQAQGFRLAQAAPQALQYLVSGQAELRLGQLEIWRRQPFQGLGQRGKRRGCSRGLFSRTGRFGGQRCAGHQKAGLLQSGCPRPLGNRQALAHQALRQQALVTPQRLGQHAHCGKVPAAAGHHVVQHGDAGCATDALQAYLALALLRRLQRIGGRDRFHGPGHRAEHLGNAAQYRARVELAAHHEHGIVGAVVLAVKGLQALDGDVFDIAACANGVPSVAMPLVGRGAHLPAENPARVVLAALHLVAHHGHLAVQVGFGNLGFGHGLGQPTHDPVQCFAVACKLCKIVGAVVPGGAVPARAAPRHFKLGVGDGPCGLEQQVLQQMRRPRLPIALVPAADPVGEVDGGRRLGRVGRQQYRQAVGQTVFNDALDLPDFSQATLRPDRSNTYPERQNPKPFFHLCGPCPLRVGWLPGILCVRHFIAGTKFH